MPNKRADGRTTKTISLDVETVEYLLQKAKSQGTNISNLIENIIRKEMKKNEKRNKDK